MNFFVDIPVRNQAANLDPQQPRIKAGLKSTFRHYLNLHRTEGKLIHLFERLQFSTMRQVLQMGSAV
jgi:hypothetical protein